MDLSEYYNSQNAFSGLKPIFNKAGAITAYAQDNFDSFGGKNIVPVPVYLGQGDEEFLGGDAEIEAGGAKRKYKRTTKRGPNCAPGSRRIPGIKRKICAPLIGPCPRGTVRRMGRKHNLCRKA